MKRVEVEWQDSTAVAMGWDTLDVYREHAYPDVIVSLGFVVEDKPEAVMLAQSWKQVSEHRKDEAVNDCLVIPRSDIRTIRELRRR